MKTVMLGGSPAVLEGSDEDPYFQAVEHHAAALGGLAALVERQIPRTAYAIDVGANIGLSSILLARLTGHVTAYEPSPPNAAFLRRNLERNGIRNVAVLEAAASHEPGVARFHIARFGAGSHVVGAGHVAGDRIATIEVPAVTLDDTALHSAMPVAFIKIDAEGHEPNVIAGAARLLARDRPLIYSEVNLWCLSAFAGHSPGAFIRTLWRAFEIGHPEPDGATTPLNDGYRFLHDTIAHHRGIADVVMRPRANVGMPSLQELSWPESALIAFRRQAGA